MEKKKKILILSDHALSTSGVGTQTRHLVSGLLEKNKWTVRQFGAALKHTDYRTIVVNDDFIIKPIDGFGNRDMIRVTLATEKPDILFIFTDPRFFIWLFEMEDEVHQVCPIVWWHVWDNRPFPSFNKALYESTDAINCHSYLTYEMVSENFTEQLPNGCCSKGWRIKELCFDSFCLKIFKPLILSGQSLEIPTKLSQRTNLLKISRKKKRFQNLATLFGSLGAPAEFFLLRNKGGVYY